MGLWQCKVLAWCAACLLEVADFGLREALLGLLTKAQLDGTVAILAVLGLDSENDVGRCVEDGDRCHGSVFGKQLGHTHFLGQDDTTSLS